MEIPPILGNPASRHYVGLFEQENLPPPKRRKIDGKHTPPHKSRAPAYVAIAHVSFPVEILSLQKKQDDGTKVEIKSVVQRGSGRELHIRSSWLKASARILVQCDRSSAQILEDCERLDSILKATSKNTQRPLACYDASLDLQAESPIFTLKILWDDSSEARDGIAPHVYGLFQRYFPSQSDKDSDEDPEPWHVREFYDNVHIPEVSQASNAPLKVKQLECELYPFQRRAVRWLLSREGVGIEPTGQVVGLSKSASRSAILNGFRKVQQDDQTTLHVNNILGVACTSRSELEHRYGGIKGGLLAEAMGLGKTVEMIALVSLHTMRNSPLEVDNTTGLTRSRATLIITPPSILEQWRQEIQAHAPGLSVYHYDGRRSRRNEAVIATLADQDIVLTTYNVLAKELHFVMEKPDRSLRERPRPDPPKSPLDHILWWRVCLDEAQMIESGVSAAALVARLIPRVNAWAVTGTPLKQSDKDLHGLLLFLKYEPWSLSIRTWNYLVNSHRPLFRAMVNEITIRHSKELVRDELRLPPQSRHTITVPFSNIEQTHYSELFYEMCSDCGLNKDGSPTDDQWDPDSPKTTEKMRSWLMRLRQTCLHPEVGGRNRKALGRANGPLRTVQQVLEVMIDQAEGSLRTEQRDMLISKIRQGQIYENAKLQEEAMAYYHQAYDESKGFVKDCRDALEAEIAARKRLDQSEDIKSDSEEDEDLTGEASHAAARQRLRSALEIQHICIFFKANIYYQMRTAHDSATESSQGTALDQTPNDLEELDESTKVESKRLERLEIDAYEEAKQIRGELLTSVLKKANREIARLTSKVRDDQLVQFPKMAISEDDYAGIESRRIFDKLYKFCDLMNEQAEQFRTVREKMIECLRQGLVDEDEGVELQGDEYESSTKQQDEMYAYMEALRALQADRSDAITGQENLLIKGEMRQFLRAAKENLGPAPELMIKLIAEREEHRIKIGEHGSLRGIMTELRALVTMLEFQEANGRSRSVLEMQIVKNMLQYTVKASSDQTKAVTSLEQEVASLLGSMNARLEYYKALQKISDTVQPYREEDVGSPLNRKLWLEFEKSEMAARNKASNLLAKQRYLLHLKNESISDSTPRICIICQSEFEIGAITSCGHVFCKDDLQLWFAAHGNCPVCKRKLGRADFYDVTYKPQEVKIQAEQSSSAADAEHSPDSPDRLLHNSIYSDLSDYQLHQIQNIELRGASFGSKVDTICRHLQWLREKDPGSKTILFSQFREYLDVLGRAFRQNKITYSRCDDSNGVTTFKSNPAVECFLLHAKAHSAGLNLVVASHVILCEPLINTAIELQAIARVHRIGQQRHTTVWMYLVSGTVEETIYDISVKRRLAHVQSRPNKDHTSALSVRGSRSGTHTPDMSTLPNSRSGFHESALESADAKALQSADLSKAMTPGKSGGEMVSKEDLWPCLFGNVKSGDSVGHGRGAVLDFAVADGADGVVGRVLRAEAAQARRGT